MERGAQTGTAEPDRPPARLVTHPLRVLVVMGHPRKDSFCEALADAYAEGAARAGTRVRRLAVADMRFELNVVSVSPRDQPVEPCVAAAMESVRWADHLDSSRESPRTC